MTARRAHHPAHRAPAPRRSRRSSAGLRWRAFAAAPGASVALAALVLVAALLAVAAPRAVEQLHTASLDARLAEASAAQLDLRTDPRDRPQLGPPEAPTSLPPEVDAVWGGQEERLVALRDGLPEPLRSVIGAPGVAVQGNPVVTAKPGAGPGSPVYRAELTADPRLREHVELVEGDWPAVPATPPTVEAATPTDGATRWNWTQDVVGPLPEPLDVVLATATAADLQWPIGEQRPVSMPNGVLVLRLSGIFEPVDATAGFWSHVVTGLDSSLVDDGFAPPEYTASAFMDPLAWPVVADQPLPITLRAWLPVAPEHIRSADSERLAAQLGEFESTAHPLGDGEWDAQGYPTVADVAFTSGLAAPLSEQRAESAAVDAVLATVASGPIGVLVAVIVLGARVVFERRRLGLELAAARGAGTGWLRGALGGEGLAIGVPAAVIGGAIAIALTPGQSAWGGWHVAALFAAAPAALLVAAAPSLTPLRRARADLGHHPSRLRWVWEGLVVVVTAVAVALLLSRGPTGVGVDPLLAAVPLLIALTGCLVVLRLYPIPLAAVVRRTKAARGLVAFLGSARALRDPSAGLVPVLAVVVGVAVAVNSSVALSTVRAGAATAAAASVGTDALVGGAPLTKDQVARIAEVPGVSAIAPVYSTSPVDLVLDGRHQPTVLVVVDVAEVDAVQQGRADPLHLPASLAVEAGDDEPVPVVASASVARAVAEAASADLDGAAFEVVDEVDARIPFTPRSNWLLMDRANAEAFTGSLVPRSVLVRLDDAVAADRGAAGAALDEVGEIAGPGTAVRTPEQITSDLLDRPDPRGLETGLLLAIGIASLLTALALVLALVVGRPARDRLLPLLSTLGLGRRGERSLVAWEIGPMTVAAVVVGTALGVAMPFLVLAGIDLTPFTGGEHQPVVVVDVPFVLAVLGGAILVAAVGALAAATIGGHANAARALRKEEEG